MNRFLKEIIGITFVLLIHTSLLAQVSMERVKVTKSISMKVPVDFMPMSQSELLNKYLSYRLPIAMFTSPDMQIDLGINKNSTPWTGDDLSIVMAFYKSNIQNLFTEVKFLQEEIKDVGGRDFVVFEFISKMTGEESTYGGISSPVSKYTYIMYTLYEDSVLLFNFSCNAKLRAQWQAPAQEIMESVRIK